jgi:hypothetical protein
MSDLRARLGIMDAVMNASIFAMRISKRTKYRAMKYRHGNTKTLTSCSQSPKLKLLSVT